MIRLDQNLNIIWNRRYDLGRNELYFGLTETRPTFSHAADLAVVGEYNDGYRSQALVARVDGVTGEFGTGDQGMALYGGDGDENFQSIVETQTSPDTGNLTMAGLSTSPGLRNDVLRGADQTLSLQRPGPGDDRQRDRRRFSGARHRPRSKCSTRSTRASARSARSP